MQVGICLVEQIKVQLNVMPLKVFYTLDACFFEQLIPTKNIFRKADWGRILSN